MVDKHGYRPCIGILLINADSRIFWGKRTRSTGWQFPQGGIQPGETPQQALLRELHEEVGLLPEDVQILGETRQWLHYDVPGCWIRPGSSRHFRGQKQKWFVLRMLGDDSRIDLKAYRDPEFSAWHWISWWMDLNRAVDFKREVYRQALLELAPAAGIEAPAPKRWKRRPQ